MLNLKQKKNSSTAGSRAGKHIPWYEPFNTEVKYNSIHRENKKDLRTQLLYNK